LGLYWTAPHDSPYVDAWLANHIELTRPDVVSGAGRPVDAFVDPGTRNLAAILERLSRFGVRAIISDAGDAS
jgi:hypothetical protein